jgi:hypothetical protein
MLGIYYLGNADVRGAVSNSAALLRHPLFRLPHY